MRTSDFDYDLPKRAIAQPPPRRDASRLLVLDRRTGRIAHRIVRDLPSLLRAGDLLVVNDTKVFRARLHGTVDGKPIEFLLVRPDDDAWLTLAKPARRLHVGATVRVGAMRGMVLGHEADGSVRIRFDRPSQAVIAYANRVGEVPTPLYVHTAVHRLAEYQTAYARSVGSVAAPTAGFHLTSRLLRTLRTKGVRIVRITLHVGLGTFQPIRTERIEDHVMHAEWASVPAATARAIAQTKARGGRIIAVGTTTLRTLETATRKDKHVFSSSHREGELEGAGFQGWVNLYITPGFRFRIVDALLTNFHLPKSSLLVLVSAFAAPGDRTLRGRDMILRAYRSALRRGYRFYSFGDAMLVQ